MAFFFYLVIVLILINQYDMRLVLVFFFFPDKRNLWWNDIFESITNQELSFAGPYPVAVGCQGQVSKSAVKRVSDEVLSSGLQMLYPILHVIWNFWFKKRHMVIDQYTLK